MSHDEELPAAAAVCGGECCDEPKSIDLQIDNGVMGLTDPAPESKPEPTPVDRGAELRAVMEALADWLDEVDPDTEGSDEFPGWVPIAAVAQILELTQLLLWEHQNVVEQMNEFIGAMAMAKAEAVKGTKLIVANAGDASKFIRP